MSVEGSARTRGRPRSGVREAAIVAAQEILTSSGATRMTTKAVATRAGVAESSIFYHFGDRTGLLQAVIQHQLRPLKEMLAEDPGTTPPDLRTDLIGLITVLENFFQAALPVIAAIESDAELRAAHTERSRDLDLGPHRALDAVIAHLSARHTLVADPRTAALLVVGAAHQRALQHRLSPPAAQAELPSPDSIADAVLPLLRPARN
ncbi:putative transcriptional regulator, TetR family [Nocardia nova SH22a]|uniref:Putative transcriptional regulator, TetR family n=1 Tax=Nocardia nova SH22a TaxID=1415166 RepID=W5TG83_9NOCA|nr:TetR/AcrR family transcriptional regulator [Nocardia nova]AHH18222.1 putative transcriptional regulator, TetR family [Nocardia nova SH22a]